MERKFKFYSCDNKKIYYSSGPPFCPLVYMLCITPGISLICLIDTICSQQKVKTFGNYAKPMGACYGLAILYEYIMTKY